MNEYLKDGLESLKDISEGAVPPEVYHLSAKAILEHINNLQSKIDKVRKIIDRYSRVIDYDDEVPIDVLYEIDDVLKENK